MVAANPQKLLGRNKKIQSEVDEQQQQLIASPINIAVSQNILKSLAKITELISQQNSQIVEIIREVKQPKSADVQPQQQLIAAPGLVGPPGPPGPSIQPPQPQQQLIAAPADIAALQDISKSLAKITQLLTQQNSQVTAEANQERKNQENAKRNKIELGLENSFAAVKNVAQSVIAPVKNILDQIIQFFVTLFLGKAILNLIDWFSKKENQSKIRSIARFLKDWWPALVAGYILFGTGFGRVVRNLASVGLRAIIGLGGIALKLSAAIFTAIGFKKAGAAMSALGGGGGLKGIAARLLVGGAIAGGGALVASKMMGGGDAPQVSIPEPATLPTAEAFGGGLIDFKTMLAASGGQVDSKLGIFAQLFGSGGLAGLMNSAPGVVSGPKGIDKVPAMLTDGEFVMSRGAVQKFGVSNLEAMNASGGGTNKPKIVQKRIHAYGGGFVGDEEIYRAAANYNRGSNLKEISYDPNNKEHKNAYEKFKKRVVDKGLYKPSPTSSPGYTPPKASPTSSPGYTPPKASPTSMVKSPGAGLSTNVKPPIQRINTNMNVPGGRPRIRAAGPLTAAFAAMEFNDRKQAGQTTIQAGLGSAGSTLGGSVGWMAGAKAGALIGGGIGAMFGGVGAAPGAAVGAIIGGVAGGYGGASLGGKLADDMSGVNAINERKNRGGIGGSIKGGYGLKQQSFKDAPKTQIMTDDKGKPFVGYKSMKDGKLHYSRGPQPGTGTSNPLEMMGRFLNPGAYKDNDAKLAMKKQRVAATNSLESLQARGASADTQSKMMKQIGGNLKDTQNDLSYRQKRARLATTPVKGKPITPTPKPAPKVYNPGGGAMGGGRGSGGGSKGTKLPTIPTGKDNTKTAKQYNIK